MEIGGERRACIQSRAPVKEPLKEQRSSFVYVYKVKLF